VYCFCWCVALQACWLTCHRVWVFNHLAASQSVSGTDPVLPVGLLLCGWHRAQGLLLPVHAQQGGAACFQSTLWTSSSVVVPVHIDWVLLCCVLAVVAAHCCWLESNCCLMLVSSKTGLCW
jgi:hypothetical protein